jgi:hypothetical protein
MVCGKCHREKAQAKAKPRRDWFLVTTLVQGAVGLAALWFTTWLLGRLLVSIPSEVHEGALWQRLGI